MAQAIQKGAFVSNQSLPPRAILEFKILKIFSVENQNRLGCYDVAKFRFVNNRQLLINAQLSIVTNLKVATSYPTCLNFLQVEDLLSRKA